MTTDGGTSVCFCFLFRFQMFVFFFVVYITGFVFSINRMLDNGVERYFAKLSIFKVCVTMETAK